MWPLIKILPVKTNFRFVGFAKFAAAFSVIAVIASLAATLFPLTPPCGGLNCGIDFRGGTVLEFSTAPRDLDVGVVREALSGRNLGDVQVQSFDARSAMVRFETPVGQNANQTAEGVKAALTQALGGDVKFSKTDVVGPKVSGELFRGGIIALGLAVGLMMIYIWFRFELQFGLGAVAGLFHDIILTFGVIAFFNLEFSLNTIAALLTIIGYSMNDTVVVFDRLRENLRKYKKMPLRDVIDLSINETLSRTVITGVTAVLALGGLAIFGGETLFTFSIIMIFGIILGTYSSIYVGAPIILMWGVKRGEDEEAKPIAQAARP